MTMKALPIHLKKGHYENRKESVDIMIRSSREVINELISYGVDFAKRDGKLDYTREGCHSKARILFHELKEKLSVSNTSKEENKPFQT